MSSGLDNIGDLLDDPGFKARSRGGGGGRQPGVGGPSFGGPGSSGGFFGGQTLGGGAIAAPGVRRRLPVGWGASLPQPGSLPTAATSQVDPNMEGGGSGGAPAPVAGLQPFQKSAARPMSSVAPNGWMRAPGAPGSISRGFGQGGGVPRPAAAPVGGPAAAPAPTAYDPTHPFDNLGSTNMGADSIQNYLLKMYGAGGAYSTEGPSALMDAVRSRALSDSEAGVQRARTAAALYAGNDPSARGYANLQGELNGQQGVSNALGDATLARLGSQDDFAKGLLTNRIGFEQGWRTNDQRWLLDRIATGEQQRGQGSGFGGWLGNVAGRALGSGLSPGGWFGGGN